MARRARILILGGTAEAACLAAAGEARWRDRATFITSLAGRTSRPSKPPGQIRIGGFGGSDGLAAYLRTAAIDAVIDATHPFSRQISEHARLACNATGTVRLSLIRPHWTEQPRDRWHQVADAAEAASLLPRTGRRVFLTVGIREIAAFASVDGAWFLVRLIEPPSAPLPLGDHQLLIAKGPFDRDSELKMLAQHRIDVLVTKASGGQATEGKIEAARHLGLPVIMVRRPPSVPGASVESVSDALEWIEALLDRLDTSALANN